MEAFVSSPGQRLWTALDAEQPLQLAGVVNAYCALLAERAGFRAIYLSGAGVANASFGLPDLGVTNLNDVCEDARRVCARHGAAATGRRRYRLRHGPGHPPHGA